MSCPKVMVTVHKFFEELEGTLMKINTLVGSPIPSEFMKKKFRIDLTNINEVK